MMKRWSLALLLALTLTLLAWPVMAAQGGVGGVHFGDYSLSPGDSVTGDLVVFGPVVIGEGAEFDGDLAAFGETRIDEDAVVTGDLAVFGKVDIAGTVEGDVLAAGEARLRESAYIEGDLAAVGNVVRDEGSRVVGEISPVDEDFDFNFENWDDAEDVRPGRSYRRPVLAELVWDFIRGMLTVVVMALFALLIASIWPKQMTRVGETLVEAPVPSFGVGLLTMLIAAVVVTLFLITICLSPLAILTGILVGIGVAVGWVALGYILGRRILRDVFRAENATLAGATVLGTTLITLLAATIDLVSDCLFMVLVMPFFALVAGAVILTRFGTQPYSTRSTRGTPPPPPPPPDSALPVGPPPPEEEGPLAPTDLQAHPIVEEEEMTVEAEPEAEEEAGILVEEGEPGGATQFPARKGDFDAPPPIEGEEEGDVTPPPPPEELG
jgi:cytoskeletal protein CcmA (bactofilin family)